MYQALARVYDEMMAAVDYQAWIEFTLTAVARFGCAQPQAALDLACGTGNAALRLAGVGYRVVGVDQSAEMLAVADQKAWEQGLGERVQWCETDLRRWTPPAAAFTLATSFCDGLNYIVEREELRRLFQKVRRALLPGGLFLFDLNTPYKFKTVYAQNTFAENFPSGSYIWENNYDEATGLCDFYLTLFLKRGELYEKYTEEHQERAYSREEVEAMLAEAGLDLLGVFAEYKWEEPGPFCLRYTFLARR